MNIDRQRVAAVRTLERQGWTFEGGEEWKPPIGESNPMARMKAATLILNRALKGCGTEKGAMMVVVHGPNEMDKLQQTLRAAAHISDADAFKRSGEITLNGIRFTYEIPF